MDNYPVRFPMCNISRAPLGIVMKFSVGCYTYFSRHLSSIDKKCESPKICDRKLRILCIS